MEKKEININIDGAFIGFVIGFVFAVIVMGG